MFNPKFEERMLHILGEEGFESYKSEFSRKSPRAFRVNSLKAGDVDVSSLFDFELCPVPYCENAFYFDYDKIGAHPLHHAGLIYVQEPGAMVPVSTIKIEPDFKIFDTCASPGGKSLQASSFLNEKGFILSNEISSQRVKVMAGNFERMGVKNAVITSSEVGVVAKQFEDFFDLVIVDAPCSGEGMFRKEPEALKNWSEDYVLLCAERQKEILESASVSVRGGGYLIYSTCTFSVEENEGVVNDFLSRHTDFELVSPCKRVLDYTLSGVGSDKFRRFYPHVAPGEGQFSALLQRKGDAFSPAKISGGALELTKEERKITEDFLKDTLISFDPSFIKKFKDYVVYIDPEIPVPQKITYSCGVTLGEVRHNYFQPHHQLFSAMGNLFKKKINLSLDDPRLESYLKGESINYDIENGWVSVLANSVCLGGGKAVNGQIKNHYPKGLRIQH
ncbi:MAG: RNA methyltransferase [Ruminococcaceae bacterium]|nr:RNA methyltransferase [Oscillospiraceae bacterium]